MAKTAEKQDQQLIPLENVSAGDLFAGDDDKKLMALAMSITNQAKSMTEDLDVAKEADRKEMASVAYKIARSKTTIDDAGKDLVSGMKKKTAAIDERRKHMRDQLDTLKGRIRAPLDRWEENEAARVEGHVDAISEIREAGNTTIERYLEMPLEAMEDRRTEIEAVDPADFQEFEERCAETRLAALAKMDTAIRKRMDHDRDQEELDKLRKEKADREEADRKAAAQKAQDEREEQIRKDAAEKAEREKEAELKREREAREQAEADRKAAEERAERAKQEAEEQQRREQEAAAEEQRRREANTRHKGEVNSKALDAIAAAGNISPATAKKIVKAIASGKIPNVTINY